MRYPLLDVATALGSIQSRSTKIVSRILSSCACFDTILPTATNIPRNYPLSKDKDHALGCIAITAMPARANAAPAKSHRVKAMPSTTRSQSKATAM